MDMGKLNLLYDGRDFFFNENKQVSYHIEELMQELNKNYPNCKELHLYEYTKQGGYHKYVMNTVGKKYNIVITNEYLKAQEEFDKFFLRLKQEFKKDEKRNKKWGKIAIYAGVASVITAAVPVVLSIKDGSITKSPEIVVKDEKQTQASPIFNYLYQQREEHKNDVNFVVSDYNMDDEAMRAESVKILEHYSLEEWEEFVSGGVLTEKGKKAVEDYFYWKKTNALYTTDVKDTTFSGDGYEVNVTHKTL